MRRLHITAEGQTEESFVNKTLKQHLARFDVFADVRCVLTGKKGNRLFRGGMTDYAKAKNDISRWLKEEQNNKDVVFTTMFDFYALPDDFPGLKEASQKTDPYEKVALIEEAFYKDINDTRFIPYIQLHEFEALLFVNPQMFEKEFFEEPDGIKKLQSIREKFVNPELIDNGPETAPSKRIINIYPRYGESKPTIGSMIAHEIGIDDLKKSCRHFNDWVTRLETIATPMPPSTRHTDRPTQTRCSGKRRRIPCGANRQRRS